MLGKLLKYDFRSMWKQFAIVWPAALVLALVNGFVFRVNIHDASQLSAILMVILMLVYVAVMISMFVLAVLFIIQRFYKGLLGDEGYLMHTLPVRPWQLVTSKLLCAVVLTVISILVALISVLLMIPLDWGELVAALKDFGRVVREVFQYYGYRTAFTVIEFLLMLLAGMAQSFLQLYLAMAIGHLFSKNRILMSVVAYIGINAVMSVLLSVLGISAVINTANFAVGHQVTDMFNLFRLACWGTIGTSVILAALFFFGTNYILKHKLNLE